MEEVDDIRQKFSHCELVYIMNTILILHSVFEVMHKTSELYHH